MEKVRIGFIGCGGISNGHAQRIASMPDAKIVAICDTDTKTLEGFKVRHPELAKTPTFTDWRAMLDDVKMDAIQIHTPHTLHFEQIMAGFERGLHVLTEKPMVCKTEHAHIIVAKVKETGLKLQVSYQRHFERGFRFAKELIASGKLGRVQFVAAQQSQEWKMATEGKWRQIPELSGGGQLNDSGSHLVDIILWVTGLVPEKVSAIIDNCGTPVDINSAVSVQFKGGAQGTISIVGEGIRWWEDVTIWGEKGILAFRNGQPLMYSSQDGELHLPQHMPGSTDPDRNFVDAILGKAELESPAECGLRVIQLTEAAWQSAKLGKSVKVAH
jgi:predicted dehydrogenase